MRFDGRCHCGNIEVEFETAQPADSLQLRECGCTFCRRHGSTALTDPAGRLEVRLRDPREVSRYRFALRTADFLVCRTCGVFVAAVCTVDGATVGYDAETTAERIARRRRAWTPAAVHEGTP